MLLDVSVLTPSEVIFEGKARSVMFPGEEGVFEVYPFHKRLLSRLISGTLIIDHRSITIRRGIVKVDLNRVTAIVEQD